jgi:NTP pyrophosphatase (non-canonical NTP hydrolase)
MTFDEYQQTSRESVVYPDPGKNIIFPSLGLAGEAGEIADHVKKAIRDDRGVFTEERRKELRNELGDTLWYVAQLASELEVSLDDIAQENLIKIKDRYQ